MILKAEARAAAAAAENMVAIINLPVVTSAARIEATYTQTIVMTNHG